MRLATRPGPLVVPGRAQPERGATGALLVVVRDPARSIRELIAPDDRITEEIAADDPQDPENLSPRHAKRALHHAVRGATLCDFEPAVLESIAGLDGAVVIDTDGRLLTFGAILRIAPTRLSWCARSRVRGPWPPSLRPSMDRCSRSVRTVT